MGATTDADTGEALGLHGFGDDDLLLPLVDTVNVACGFHAGDPGTVRATVAAAAAAGVTVGAHPGLPDVDAFVRVHQGSPWLTSMVGLVAGLPFCCQAVPRERRLQVPEHVGPRTGTPQADGGARWLLRLHLLRARRGRPPGVRDRPGPHLRARPVLARLRGARGVLPPRRHRGSSAGSQEEEHRDIEAAVAAGTHRVRQRPVELDLDAHLGDPGATNASLLAVLGDDRGPPGGPGHVRAGHRAHRLLPVRHPPSGAVDQLSARVGDLLVGNDEGAAVLGCTYPGPVLRFAQDAVRSCRAAGRPTGLGGHLGRVLQVGDALPVGLEPGAPPAPVGFEVPRDLRPAPARDTDVRVVMGPYDDRLTDAGRADLLGTTWTLTAVADRVGSCCSGAQLGWVEREQPFGAGADASSIVDAGYPIGSTQVPAGSEPIVLHRDAVSACSRP